MKESRERPNETDASRMDDRLRLLEAALDRAIERSREAKRTARQAKEEAKLAKKEKKRARKALIEAQQEYGIQLPLESLDLVRASADDVAPRRVLGDQIAESPERRRAPRKRKSKVRSKRTSTVSGNVQIAAPAARIPVRDAPRADVSGEGAKQASEDK
jgi:hypothetical protein